MHCLPAERELEITDEMKPLLCHTYLPCVSLLFSGNSMKNDVIIPIMPRGTKNKIGPFYDHKIDDSYAMEISKGYRKMVKSPINVIFNPLKFFFFSIIVRKSDIICVGCML